MIQNKAVLWVAALIALLLAVSGCGGNEEAVTVPERPAEPAGVEANFRPDSVQFVAATDRPQLIEFFAFWCTTCNAMKPLVHELEAEYWNQVDFVYLDIDDGANAQAMEDFGFVAQPLFVLITAEGEEIQRWFGYVSADDFRAAFDDLLRAAGG